MKIIFLARSLDSSRVIADFLLQEKLIDKVVFETGKVAKKKKIVRMLKKRPLWKLLLLPFDIFFLLIMTSKANRLFNKRYKTIPNPPIDLWVDDVNEETSQSFLKNEQPDILLIYGTSILKKSVLNIPKLCVLNIHGAIVPKYRNVHGEFWAVAHHNYEELGTSILVADEGVDSGSVVSQRTIGVKKPISVSEAKLSVFEETLKITREVLLDAHRGNISKHPQSKLHQAVFQTPTFFDWIKFRVKL